MSVVVGSFLDLDFVEVSAMRVVRRKTVLSPSSILVSRSQGRSISRSRVLSAARVNMYKTGYH